MAGLLKQFVSWGCRVRSSWWRAEVKGTRQKQWDEQRRAERSRVLMKGWEERMWPSHSESAVPGAI